MDTIRSEFQKHVDKLEEDDKEREKSIRGAMGATSKLLIKADSDLLSRLGEVESKISLLMEKDKLSETFIDGKLQELSNTLRRDFDGLLASIPPPKLDHQFEVIKQYLQNSIALLHTRFEEYLEPLESNMKMLREDVTQLSSLIYDANKKGEPLLGLIKEKIDARQLQERMDTRLEEFRTEISMDVASVQRIQREILSYMDRISKVGASVTTSVDEKVNQCMEKLNKLEERIRIIFIENPKTEQKVNKLELDFKKHMERPSTKMIGAIARAEKSRELLNQLIKLYDTTVIGVDVFDEKKKEGGGGGNPHLPSPAAAAAGGEEGIE